MPNTGDRVAAKWPNMMEDAVNSSSIVAEHHALMGVVLQSIRFVNSGLKEAMHYAAQEDDAVQRLFCVQFQALEHPALLSN